MNLTRWRLGAAFLVAMAILLGFAPEGVAAAGVELVIDGQRVEASPPPVIVDGRTLVPVRVVSETLGGWVEWNGQSRTVTVTRGSRILKLRIGNRLVDLAGGNTGFTLTDVPPRILEDRTFIPLRLVATALGVYVWWDAATRTVFVDSRLRSPGAPASSLAITSVRPGQAITGPTDLQVALAGPLPGEVAEIRFLLLDPETGRGPIVARGNVLSGVYRLLPDPSYGGRRALAAAIYDEAGRFLAGDAALVEMAVIPRVSLTGLSPGQRVEGAVPVAVAPGCPGYPRDRVGAVHAG